MQKQELSWMTSLWRNLFILGSRYCSANATKSAFPARKQRELWCILSQKRGCVVGRGRSHCKLQAAKPCVTVKPLLDFPLCLLDNKRAWEAVKGLHFPLLYSCQVGHFCWHKVCVELSTDSSDFTLLLHSLCSRETPVGDTRSPSSKKSWLCLRAVRSEVEGGASLARKKKSKKPQNQNQQKNLALAWALRRQGPVQRR